MNFFEKITGSDMKKEWKAYEARIEALPSDYREAWEEVESNIWLASDFTGRNLMPIFDGIICLLEESAADGQSLEDVLGNDIKGFCEALTGNEGSADYRDKWRKQLNDNVSRKLNKLNTNSGSGFNSDSDVDPNPDDNSNSCENPNPDDNSNKGGE